MARSPIPDPIKRRHLVDRKVDETQAAKIAQAYLAEEREVEAIDFLAMAGDAEGLESLVSKAVERGDGFLLKAAAGALGREPSAAEWEGVARAAESAGRLRYAETARRQSEGGGTH